MSFTTLARCKHLLQSGAYEIVYRPHAAGEAAGEIFEAEVVAPTRGEPTARGRLEALCDRFLAHVERRVFPEGCFFAAVGAELDTHPGRVRDAVARFEHEWTKLIEDLAREARDRG